MASKSCGLGKDWGARGSGRGLLGMMCASVLGFLFDTQWCKCCCSTGKQKCHVDNWQQTTFSPHFSLLPKDRKLLNKDLEIGSPPCPGGNPRDKTMELCFEWKQVPQHNYDPNPVTTWLGIEWDYFSFHKILQTPLLPQDDDTPF